MARRTIGYCLLTTILFLQADAQGWCMTCTGGPGSVCENPNINSTYQAGVTNGDQCLTKYVYNISNANALVQVTRGVPLLEEEAMELGGTTGDLTGTICSSTGTIATCTSLCTGSNCNNETMTGASTISTTCLTCSYGNPTYYTNSLYNAGWTNCSQGIWDGEYVTETTCAGTPGTLGAFCFNSATYNDDGELSGVTRGCGAPITTGIITPVTTEIPSSMGICQSASVSTYNNLTTCTKGYQSDVNTDVPMNEGLALPANSIQCIQCAAQSTSYNFNACLAYQGQNSSYGVSWTVCGAGVSMCMTTAVYDNGDSGSPVAISRGCAAQDSVGVTDSCDWTTSSDAQQQCTTTCAASSVPCNAGMPAYNTDAGSSTSSGLRLFWCASLTYSLSLLR